MRWPTEAPLPQPFEPAGRRYRLYEIPVDIAFEHQPGDAKLSLQLAAAQLKCGEAMSCRVVGQWPQVGGVDPSLFIQGGARQPCTQLGTLPVWQCTL